MKPIIGLVGRLTQSGNFVNFELHQEYIDVILKLGGDPLILYPGGETRSYLKEQLALCDGIVLTGGDEIPETDYMILDYALKNNIPILGICLGMQSMATFQTKETLVEIPRPHHHKGYKPYAHVVQLQPQSRLAQIMGRESIKVNSRHKQSVKSAGIFKVSGRDEEGTIESIENPHHRFQIGVQWHPESMVPYDEDSRKLWNAFLSACIRKEED